MSLPQNTGISIILNALLVLEMGLHIITLLPLLHAVTFLNKLTTLLNGSQQISLFELFGTGLTSDALPEVAFICQAQLQCSAGGCGDPLWLN